MQKEILYAKPSSFKGSKSFETPMFPFDLLSFIEKMKKKSSWKNNGINSIILSKTPVENIVLTAIHNETEIFSFQSCKSITFQVLEGELVLHKRKEPLYIKKGQTFTIYENIKYKLTTEEETIFLLITRNK